MPNPSGGNVRGGSLGPAKAPSRKGKRSKGKKAPAPAAFNLREKPKG